VLSVDISSMCGQFFQQAGNSTQWKFYLFFSFLILKKDFAGRWKVFESVMWDHMKKIVRTLMRWQHICLCILLLMIFSTSDILSHTFSCFLILSQLLTYFLIPILIFNTFSTSDILSHTNPISILSHFFMLRQHRKEQKNINKCAVSCHLINVRAIFSASGQFYTMKILLIFFISYFEKDFAGRWKVFESVMWDHMKKIVCTLMRWQHICLCILLLMILWCCHAL